ncbi:uncharacterized protein LOC131166190 [Malania oleifera]|uniref:uncharacterized protein LOC131166190 n=1 Tax=Malania oleifera TaxID=397392 RepID=UPI0025AE93C9|nr:uncharacterized protein LOC131166190 [Malania oleifera]
MGKKTLCKLKPFESPFRLMSLNKLITMNQKTEKLVRRTTMVATVTASYFLLTADYGPEPNVLDPIKKAIQTMEHTVKGFIFGSEEKPQGSQDGQAGSNSAKDQP